MIECEAKREMDADLELDDGGIRLTVHVALPESSDGGPGYLRLAFGHGGLANRLLNSVGETGRLITDRGNALRVRITSAEPTGAPGYLCAFSVCEGPQTRAAERHVTSNS
jgi:hypothetical protein